MSQKFVIGLVLLGTAAIAQATDPPLARIGYTTGSDYHIIPAWEDVDPSTPGAAEGAQYYYVRDVEVGGVQTELWTALLYYLGGEEWKLEVTNDLSTSDLTLVTFPYEVENTPLPGDSTQADRDENIVFGPGFAGQAAQVGDSGTGLMLPGTEYPGPCFAPFIIIADDDYARIAFASNFPPRTVFPNARLNGFRFEYQDLEIGYRESDSFLATVKTVSGNTSAGIPPWYMAALEYRTWLRTKMGDEGLYPVAYNDWMIENQGFLNIQLESLSSYLLGEGVTYDFWNDARDDLSWTLMWGQMAYHNEPDGCCIQDHELDPRYTGENAFGDGLDIYTFVNAITGYGQHVGFYSRSLDDFDDYSGTLTVKKQEWWAHWLENQRYWGANSNYLDVLGAANHGPVLDIAHLFDNAWTVSGGTSALGFDIDTTNEGTDALIEGVQDFYPAAFLISGLQGLDTDEYYTVDENDLPEHHDAVETGGPLFTLDKVKDNTTNETIFFPRLASVVLNDRIFYSGESNGGLTLMADWNYRNQDVPPDTSRNYWIERNAFLMGHKLDLIHITLRDYATENPRMRDIFDLRTDHYWWARNMEYEDVFGLTNVDSRLRVRRFSDLNGQHVFAVEWWDFDPNNIPSPLPTFTHNSVTYDAPEAIFGIVETAWNYDDTSPCDSNNNRIPDYAENSYCLFDIFPDGVIDSADEAKIDSSIGYCFGSLDYQPVFDFDCDGCVDVDDKALITAALGKTCD